MILALIGIALLLLATAVFAVGGVVSWWRAERWEDGGDRDA